MFSTTADNASSPTERMRISSDGIILAGGLTSARPFITLGTPRFQTGGGGGAGYLVTNGSSDAQFGFDRIGFTGSQYYVLNGSSVGVVLNSGSTAWAGQSDERTKTNLEPIVDGLNKINSLRAVTGRYNTDDENISRSFLIAQDVQSVLPQAVSQIDDELGTLVLRYTEVIPLLVAALKESKERIETLETSNADLLARVSALESA